jgi:tetratricopeptide (TPR) repeat protein
MPVRLSCQYPFPAINQIYRPIFLLSSIFVAVLAAAVIISKRYTRKILFGSLLFLIILLPALQLIPFGNSISSDRHAYIALIGLFYLIGELTLWIYSRLRKYTKIPFLILLIAITGALAFLSWHRCKVWKDSLSLWSDVLDNYPNLPIAYYNRGLAYFDKNEFDKALLDYNRALRISPNFLEPYMKRAWIYVIKGQYDKAISDYSQVIRANPNFALAYVNRAVINSYIGENAKAWEDVKKAMDLGFKVDLGLIKELQDKLER